jgi:hypothetical protein
MLDRGDDEGRLVWQQIDIADEDRSGSVHDCAKRQLPEWASGLRNLLVRLDGHARLICLRSSSGARGELRARPRPFVLTPPAGGS